MLRGRVPLHRLTSCPVFAQGQSFFTISVFVIIEDTIRELHRRACEIFDLSPKQVSIWDYFSHQKHALMNDMEQMLDNANIQMDRM
ncbi:hypothetical protein ACS0TY_002959 [Phlomoides rotata]